MFWVVAWVQVELRSLSSSRRCMLFDWLLLLLLLSKVTFSRDCVQGWWVPSSEVCFSAMADCTSAKSHALNRALNLDFRALWKALNCNFTMFFVKAYLWYQLGGEKLLCKGSLDLARVGQLKRSLASFQAWISLEHLLLSFEELWGGRKVKGKAGSGEMTDTNRRKGAHSFKLPQKTTVWERRNEECDFFFRTEGVPHRA